MRGWNWRRISDETASASRLIEIEKRKPAPCTSLSVRTARVAIRVEMEG